MLPHYTQLSVTLPPQEPVYTNLFETTFVLPTILTTRGYDPFMLLQQGTTIDLDLTPDLQTVSQRFKYSTRVFSSAGPDKTDISFSITFNVNVNDNLAMESWNILKAWYDLQWNSQNGTLHYKRDVVGTLIVNQHDKLGYVLRRVTFNSTQILGVDGIKLDWGNSASIWQVTARFVSDYFVDNYYDQNFTIDTPLVSGY